MKTLSRTCAVAGGAALLSAVTAITAAHAASVAVPQTGTLLAEGAGVSVLVTFDCDAGQTANLFVDVAQKVDDQHAATGTAVSDPVDCAAGEETAEMVLPVTGDFVFIEGEALVKVSLFACDISTCDSMTTTGVAQFTGN